MKDYFCFLGVSGTDVTVNSLHPGIIETDLWQHFHTIITPIGVLAGIALFKMFGKTPLQGAQTTIYAAVEPSLQSVTNKYFSDCREVTPSQQTFDETAAKRLWDISERITQDGINQS
ncbi:unnamed protein product [Lymnaea stagnalis]|uniref:Uncharacterized protein n=1 Tax=Lymnaea stagnalis TaxID=6523 RepID=A0AAV2HQ94_LYMST